MDELFFFGYNRIEEIIKDIDETTRVRIEENINVLFVAYGRQKRRAKQAEISVVEVSEKYEALKRQLKSSETTND